MNAPNGVMYSISGVDGGGETITVFVPGHDLKTAFSGQANYDEIVRLAKAGDHTVIDVMTPEGAVRKAIEQYQDYTERISVADGRVYFDREEIDNSLTTYILRLLNDGENFLPWMKFMENLQQNPQAESREMLFEFLRACDITLTPDGHLVCYKGVQNKDGTYHSLNSGTAIVDGKTITGTIPYPIGSTVEMPRSEVAFDPNNACSTGLHVATRSFAESYGRTGVVLEVHVNPRDVVSVPRDASGEKVRVSRLYVAGINEKRIEESVRHTGFSTFGNAYWEPDEYEYEDSCPDCEADVSSLDVKPEADVKPLDEALDETPAPTAANEPPKRSGGMWNWLKKD